MSNLVIRHAQKADLAALYALECQCFHVDRLSHRSFRRHLTSDTSELLIASEAGACVGYGLVLYRRGTRLARLYSLAVSPVARGRGIAPQIINHLEQHAAARGYHHMRLEVAKTNCSAIRLYQISGYRTFGEYQDYYQDHSDALRMQKCIRHVRDTGFRLQAPWWPQSTEFTCGPAALMMAMTALKPQQVLSIERELDIWREATTVFMTSGMGRLPSLWAGARRQKTGLSLPNLVKHSATSIC